MKWYALQVVAGKEEEVAENIKKKLEESMLKDLFEEILAPLGYIQDTYANKKKRVRKQLYPGYILLKMHMSQTTCFFIKKIKNVIGFVGFHSSGMPVPLTDNEFSVIKDKIKINEDKINFSKKFLVGEVVRIIDGPFFDFNGKVEEVNYSKNKLCVGVLIFGRSTPIDLNFNQVEKL